MNQRNEEISHRQVNIELMERKETQERLYGKEGKIGKERKE
jgi:hypothetical protein